MALTKKGLTVGIEIDGPANGDRRLLGIALTLERILGSLPPPPGF
jgi:mandelamide amidase